MDVAGLYSDGKLQGVASCMASYGYFGDLMFTSERWRHIGPSRYLLSGIWQIIKNKSYNVSIKMRTPSAQDTVPVTNDFACNDQCSTCCKATVKSYLLQPDKSPDQWIEVIIRWKKLRYFIFFCQYFY